MVGSVHPQNCDEKKEMIGNKFSVDPSMSLINAGTLFGLHHKTIQDFLKRELKYYRYKLKRH